MIKRQGLKTDFITGQIHYDQLFCNSCWIKNQEAANTIHQLVSGEQERAGKLLL